MKRAALLGSLACGLCAAPALADEPTPRVLFGTASDTPAAPPATPRVAVRLDYVRGASADACPDERALHSAVAVRLGYDPFTPAQGALPVLRVSLAPQGGAFVARAEKRDPDGRVVWSRPALADADCSHLVAVLGLSIAISLDPAALGSPPVVAPLPAEPPPAPLPPPPAVAPPPTLSRSRPSLRLGLRAGLAVATGPAPAATFAADVGVRGEAWSVSLEGRADAPVTADVDQGVRLRTSVLAAALIPCGHWRWFVGCGVVTLGSLRLEALHLDPTTPRGVVTPHSGYGVYAAAGLRAGLEWPVPLLRQLALRLSGEALITLHPVTGYRTTPEAAAWVTPPFAGLLGAGAVVAF